jgi:hypothetical protein
VGDVEAVATHAAVAAALGDDTEAAIEAGRSLDAAAGMAVVRVIAAQATA